jgi:hypothetical protein
MTMPGLKHCAALLMLCAAGARADENCEPAAERTVVNADRSTLSVTTTCATPGMRTYTLRAVLADGQRDQMALHAESETSPFGGAQLIDIDGDGNHEVEVRGSCGAGPNCEGALYRIDPAAGKLRQWFSGGYAQLSVLDGHLLEAGRASCCSWEYHAYRLRDEGVHGYDNMDLMIEVGMDPSDEGENAPARCVFSRPQGDNPGIVMPPNPQWLALCELYGDYRLVTPEQARAAQRPDGAQE